MSADYWLEIDTGGPKPVHLGNYEWNCTYNLGPMLRAAGFPDWILLDGAQASDAAGMLDNVSRTLRSDPEKFRAMNPPNGWGDYEGAIEFVESMRDGCAANPRATIGASL